MLARILAILLAFSAVAPFPGAQIVRDAVPRPTGLRIAAWLPDGPRVAPNDHIRLRVVARDLGGHPISVRLLTPPPGLTFPSIRQVSGPVSLDLVWRVPDTWGGRRVLTFEVTDGTHTKRTQLTVDIDGYSLDNGLFAGDVTGDGLVDIVATSGNASPQGVTLAGELYVWAGGSSPSATPTATLTLSPPVFLAQLGGESPLLVDLDRDGTLDVLATASMDVGGTRTDVLCLWKGGPDLKGTRQPDAQLIPADPVTDPMLTRPGYDLIFFDVTRDGIDDVIAHSRKAVYVWSGALDFTGSVPPTATLVLSPAVATLFATSGTRLHIGDVTGDGWPDILSGAPQADTGGVQDSGAIFLWAGGPGLSGTRTETSVLSVPGASSGDAVGSTIRLGDVTGDGVLDVVAAAAGVDVGGIVDQGAVYVWNGGAFGASAAPTSTLYHANPASSDALGDGGLYLEDLTGDGQLDVCAASTRVSVGGFSDVGSMFVWDGTQLTGGILTQTATLEPPPTANLRFASASGLDRIRIIEFRDLDTDGVVDLLAVCNKANARGRSQVGAIYLWYGGASIVGTLPPTASLTVPGATSGANLGTLTGNEMHFGDVTGDGVEDLITGTYLADGADAAEGRLYVWRGGVSYSGETDPLATLRLANPSRGDRLGDTHSGGLAAGRQAVQLADLTGDGVLDILCSGVLVDDGSVQNVGAIGIWAGGAALSGTRTPTATLWGEANSFDTLGDVTGQAVHCADLDGDGFPEVLSGSTSVDRTARTPDVGAYYVWSGGSALTGNRQPTSILHRTNPDAFDQLGTTCGEGLRLADVTGDGTLDLLGSSRFININGTQSTGAIFPWDGAALCNGICPPTVTMFVPGAGASSALTCP